MSQSALYSEAQAKKANLTLERLGLKSWEADEVKALQTKVGAKPVDGWLGPKSIAAWKAWAKKNESNPVSGGQEGHLDDPAVLVWPGQFIINGVGHTPPSGVTVVNFLEPKGVPAELDDTNERKYPVTQFVFHLGAESHRKDENYAQATERILDARGLSTTMTMDIDGAIYQHFDPGLRRGRHATYHNVQSDSMDIGSPFGSTKKPEPGQVPLTFKAAIGREDDHKPPMSRTYGTVKCLDLTPAQKAALVAFIPWYCNLRGIPLTACDDWRTFRIGGQGTKDPVTNVKGLVAHMQISDPGRRVDGVRALMALKDGGAPIEWRSGEDFLKT